MAAVPPISTLKLEPLDNVILPDAAIIPALAPGAIEPELPTEIEPVIVLETPLVLPRTPLFTASVPLTVTLEPSVTVLSFAPPVFAMVKLLTVFSEGDVLASALPVT